MAALAPGLGLKGVVLLTWDSLRVVVQVFLGVRQVHGLSLQGSGSWNLVVGGLGWCCAAG